MAKITKEKFKTYGSVFDNFTNANLVSLAKKGYFSEGTLSPIKIGKEANIFSAEDDSRKKLCLKIYRLETANFNRMYEYIRSDPRFIGLLHKKRKVIFAWVQREFRNLMIASRSNISAPRPFKSHFNVLIMDFIGGKTPAPMMKDRPPKHPSKFLDGIIKSLQAFYQQGFVHGDLSKFNILNHKERPVLIDFSHATPERNPLFTELMERDCKNLADDFQELGVQVSKEEILKRIKK